MTVKTVAESRKITLLFTICLLLFALRSNGQWQTICDSGNGFVDNFEVYNGELYATGFFTTLCGVPCNYVAKYDGNAWQAVGDGLAQAGHHLQVIDSSLYAVRYEPAIDSNWLYKFDGNNFTKFGEGVFLTTAVTGFSQTANLYNVIKYGNDLVVCGEFDRAGNKHVSGIIRWNGTKWDSLGSGLSGNIPGTAPVMYPHDLCLFGNDLVVAGNFQNAGGQTVNGIARWDGTQWHPLGSGFNSTVYGICVYNGELYAGGDFTMSGSNVVSYIAKWNGSSWISPGFTLFYINPFDYTFIHTLKVIDNKLIISGGFDRVVVGTDTMFCTAVASYDGTTIDTLRGGLTGEEAEATALFNGALFEGGGLNGRGYIASYDLISSVQDIQDPGTDITIFPNPAASWFNVRSIEKIKELRVSDLTGQIVYEAHPDETKTTFRVVNKGIYIVRISFDTHTLTKKIIVSN
jgi:hypothetical protein